MVKQYKLGIEWTEWGDPQLVDKKAGIKTTMRTDMKADQPEIQGLQVVEISEDGACFKSASVCALCETPVAGGHLPESNEPIAPAPDKKYRSFQEWSQQQNVKALAAENQQGKPPPQQYQQLLDKFPDIQTCDFQARSPVL